MRNFKKISTKFRKVIAISLSVLTLSSTAIVPLSVTAVDLSDSFKSKSSATSTSDEATRTKDIFSVGGSISVGDKITNSNNVYSVTEIDTNTSKGKVRLSSFNNTKNGVATIPDTFTSNGITYTVIGVENGVFANKSDITTLKLGKSIVSLGSQNINSMPKLQSIVVDSANSYLKVVNNVLYRFNVSNGDFVDLSLYAVPPNINVTTLNIANTIVTTREFGSYAVGANVPVTRIDREACENLVNVETINFSQNVSKLTYLLASDGTIMAQYHNGPFSSCKKLKSFSVNSNNTKFVSSNGVLYSKDKKTLWSYPQAKTGGTYTIETNTEILAHNCFEDATNLQTISLNNNNMSRVRYFGQNAFEGCEKTLKSITYSPQKYYKGQGETNSESFVSNSLLNQKVYISATDLFYKRGVTFSIGYSTIFLNENLIFGDSTSSEKNDVLSGIRNWYSSIGESIEEKVQNQKNEADSLALSDEIKNLVQENNEGFLECSTDELKSDTDRMKYGKNNEGNSTYLTKSAKWTDTDKTKAQVNINYTSGATTGIDVHLELDKTASMISTGATNTSDLSSDSECPSSRILAQYSFVYNIAKGLVSGNSYDNIDNRISVAGFSGDVNGNAYAKILCSDRIDSSDNTLIADGINNTVESVLSDSNIKEDDLFIEDVSAVKNFLDNLTIRAGDEGGLGTSYTHSMEIANEILAKKASGRKTNIIFVSDGGPNGDKETESNIKSASEKTRKNATIYTVLEGVFPEESIESAKNAMGWITNCEYDPTDSVKSDKYEAFNKSGSNQDDLNKAFKSIFENIFIKKNVVIKDYIQTNNFKLNNGATITLNVQKYDKNTDKYTGHKFSFAYNSSSKSNYVGSLVCSDCGKTFNQIYGTTNARFNIRNTTTTQSIELHIPKADYRDIYSFTFDLDITDEVKNSEGGKLPTNSDGYNVPGCFVYYETDSEVLVTGLNKTFSTVSPCNEVESPILKRGSPTVNIKIYIQGEYFDYSKGKYVVKPETDTNAIQEQGLKTISGKDYSVNSNTQGTSTGYYVFRNLPVYSGSVVLKYNIKRFGVPQRYQGSETEHTFTASEVEQAYKSGKDLSYTFSDTLQKGDLEIVKHSFDNNVSGLNFRVTTPTVASETYGKYNKVITTDSNGIAVIQNLPIYDTDNTLVKYNLTELGFKTGNIVTDNGTETQYAIPEKYIAPEPQLVTLSTSSTKTTFTFTNNATPDFSVKVGNINTKKYGKTGDFDDDTNVVDLTNGKVIVDESGKYNSTSVGVDNIYENEAGSFTVTFKNKVSQDKTAPCVITIDGKEIYNKTLSFKADEEKVITLLYDYQWDISERKVEATINYPEDYLSELVTTDNIDTANLIPAEWKNFATKIIDVTGDDVTKTESGYTILANSNATLNYTVSNDNLGREYTVPLEILYEGKVINEVDGVIPTVTIGAGKTDSYSFTFTTDKSIKTEDLEVRINWEKKDEEIKTTDNNDITVISTYRKVGAIQINKTSEDNEISGIAFLITGTDNSSVIVQTDDNGVATASKLFLTTEDGETITYTIKELGVLKAGAVTGSQNINDYELPERYEAQSAKTVTINSTSVPSEVTFDNVLIKGTINITKENTTGDKLKGVGYVLCDNNKNVVPMSVVGNTATYAKGGTQSYVVYTDNNGKVEFNNLPIRNNYYVKEVQTINGYNLLKDYVEINNLTYKNPTVSKTIINNQVYDLPVTGGKESNMETLNIVLVSIICVLLVAIGGYIIYDRRKKK